LIKQSIPVEKRTSRSQLTGKGFLLKMHQPDPDEECSVPLQATEPSLNALGVEVKISS